MDGLHLVAFGVWRLAGSSTPINELVYELATGHHLLHMRVRDGVLRKGKLYNIASACYELDAPITYINTTCRTQRFGSASGVSICHHHTRS